MRGGRGRAPAPGATSTSAPLAVSLDERQHPRTLVECASGGVRNGAVGATGLSDAQMTTPTTKRRIRMRLHYDGEPTEGLLLVERLLIEGHRDEAPLDRTKAESAIEALELLDLPWAFGEMVEGGERLAEQIHSQA